LTARSPLSPQLYAISRLALKKPLVFRISLRRLFQAIDWHPSRYLRASPVGPCTPYSNGPTRPPVTRLRRSPRPLPSGRAANIIAWIAACLAARTLVGSDCLVMANSPSAGSRCSIRCAASPSCATRLMGVRSYGEYAPVPGCAASRGGLVRKLKYQSSLRFPIASVCMTGESLGSVRVEDPVILAPGV
jgi:hypothetical protein